MKPSWTDDVAAARTYIDALDFESLKNSGLYRDPLDYYLLATYPPIKAMHPVTAAEVFAETAGAHRVYVHIPFCEQYCTFCHYTKEINPKADRVERYLEALFAEIESVHRAFGRRIPAHSVFFGGGTPSYLNADQLERVLGRLWPILDLQHCQEVIFELHPGLVRLPDYEERITVLKRFGVTRWVSGVQSMDEKILQKLNRGHGRAEVFRLIDILAAHGCEDVSLDLIYGLPYQTLKNWRQSMLDLIEAGVQKFNVFPLMFKPGDPITLQYHKEPEIFPGPEDRLLMHAMADQIFQRHGFRKGPILYYSKGKHQYRRIDETEDSSVRIEGLGLVCFGVSGFGYLNHTQYFNVCDMDTYIGRASTGEPPVWLGYRLSLEERMRRAIMFGLRSRGIRRDDFIDKFGIDPLRKFAPEFEILERLGLLRTGDRIIELTPLGEIDAAGVAVVFSSPEVRERIERTNSRMVNPRRDLLEIHDFSPIAHKGVR